MTAATTAIMTAYPDKRTSKPGTALFCGPHGQQLSRDALEHRLALHLATATAHCPGLAVRREADQSACNPRLRRWSCGV